MYTISSSLSDRKKPSSLPPKMPNHDIVPSNRPHPPTNYEQYSAAPTSYGEHEMDRGMVKPATTYASGRNAMMRVDQGLSFSSDDTALNKQILATHAAVTEEELNIRPVLSVVDHIIRLGKPITADIARETQMQAHLETVDEKSVVAHNSHKDHKDFHHSYHDTFLSGSEHDAEIVKLLAFPISKISSEMICKCAAGSAAHAVTMDLLKSLSSYSWDTKAVITFAAFAIKYGEFWLVEHLHTKNSLAKNIAILKDLPGAMEHNGELRKTFEEVCSLLDATMKVTHCIVEFHELPSPYISRESPEMSAATAHIPISVYWIIRSLLVCKSLLMNLTGNQSEYMTATAESWEVLSLAHKLSVILDHLQKNLMICRDIIEKKKSEDAYTAFKKLMERSHIDNMKVLKAIIRTREDQRPLYDGSKRINERLEVLRMKYVLVLISDLQLPQEELNILHLIFNQSTMRHEYEVLWLPIVGPITATQSLPSSQDTLFYELRNNNMPWYSVDHPSLVEPVAIRYIREVWRFNHMPMLVVLDPEGKASNIDALPMMWIWGSNAFPFTKIREKALWMENKWNIELLADAIDPRIPEWIRSNRVICLYGGEDIEWIRKFTLSARAVANALQVPLEMLYVGKRNPKAKVQHCHEVINREKLSHVFSPNDYYDYIWYFWVRLWSMWNSKKQLGMTIENDNIMQEIMDLLTFDSSEQGWAVFSRGNNEMTKGKGDVILPVMENYERWGYKVDHSEKFVFVLDEEIKGTSTEHHCNRLILPGHAGYIPDQIVCSECGKMMDKYVMYRCCTD